MGHCERTIEKCEEIALNTTNNIIIAKDGERVIGFVQYGRYNYEDLDDKVPSALRTNTLNVAVLPSSFSILKIFDVVVSS